MATHAAPATIDASGTQFAYLSDTYLMALEFDESSASVNGTVLVGETSYPVDGQRAGRMVREKTPLDFGFRKKPF
jgi:hypothetical protein